MCKKSKELQNSFAFSAVVVDLRISSLADDYDHIYHSIVVSIKVEDIDDLDIELLEIYYLLINSIMKGFLIRGSIVYGKLIHTKDIIFGPALVEAYNRESKIAKYPRVIIDDVIFRDLNELPFDKPREHSDLIQYDNDGLLYIDIFKSLNSRVDNFRQVSQFMLAYTDILLDIIHLQLMLTI